MFLKFNMIIIKTLLLAYTLLLYLCEDIAQPVNIYLDAGWPAAPLIFEIMELVPKLNSSSYFNFIETIADEIEDKTEQQVYELSLNKLKKDGIVKHKDIQWLELMLAQRITVPKVQAYFQFFEETVKQELDQIKECAPFVQIGNNQLCELDKIEELISKEDIEKESLISSQKLPFDHVYPTLSKDTNLPIAILYINSIDNQFLEFHKKLVHLTQQGKLYYILRYLPNEDNKNNKVYLSGYGAQLDIKNMEYKTVDDRKVEVGDQISTNKVDSEYDSHNNTLINELISEPTILIPLKEDNYTNLNFKLTKYALDSNQPLSTLNYLIQNFPKHSTLLTKQKIKENQCFGIQIQKDWFRTTPAPNTLLVNGIQVNLEDMDSFRLLEILNIEQSTVNSLINLGLNKQKVVKFLNHGLLYKSKKKNVQTFDTRETESEDKVIIWLNDLEKDEMYTKWNKKLQALLDNAYGGYLPEVALNYANVILALDFNNLNNLDTLNSEIIPLIKNQVPIRFGILPLVSEASNDNKVATALELIYEKQGSQKVMELLEQLHTMATKEEDIKITLKQVLKQNNLINEDQLNDNIKVDNIKKYMKRLNLNLNEAIYFINGQRLNFDHNYQRSLITTLNKQISEIREMIQQDKIKQGDRIYDYLLSQNNVYKAYDKIIFDDKNNFINYDSPILDHTLYFYSKEQDEISPPISLILISDLNSVYGIKLAIKALKQMENIPNVRITILHHSTNLKQSLGFSTLIYSGLKQKLNIEQIIEEIDSKEFNVNIDMDEEELHYWNQIELDIMNLDIINNNLVILNGKVYEIHNNELDFNMLIHYEKQNRIDELNANILESDIINIDLEKKKLANLIIKISSIIGNNQKHHLSMARFESDADKRTKLPEFSADECKFEIGNQESAIISIQFILNPTSKEALRWLPILYTLSKLKYLFIEGYFNPNDDLDQLKKMNNMFYRFNFNNQIEFNSNGYIKKNGIQFNQLPKDTLLTLKLDTISAWSVMPSHSIHDLDNLIINSQVIDASFTLNHILIEGHAIDLNTQSSPRGLQFILNTKKYSNLKDTIVMANLGYFQLKANPGLYFIDLREGRSKQLYNVHQLGTGFELHNQLGKSIFLNTWGGVILFPKVIKKPGMEKYSLLQEEESQQQETSIWDNWFNNKKQKEDTIHIFTVASGHLYERFLSVMMLSVIKNTNSKVKFWFIENFFSPKFKEFIPKMANKYGFDYQMVTYQWPHWLNHQSEKQRVLWGYKILFLDVLFPLDVDKIIFVDADQIVRADLKELIEMDLQGAPYGYVPFCKSRESMKGYRFWELGYWKEHLKGKPYHISALYVVDLKRFRSLAAGDQLRGHYQMLSYDPNSLANLDQDLPNHLQPRLPIFSLPQEWLWCETWCDDKSLKKAKTIDLCNNPETKEPKLDRAKRILPEWSIYDKEIAEIRDTVYQSSSLKDKQTSTENDKQTQKEEQIETSSKIQTSEDDEMDEL